MRGTWFLAALLACGGANAATYIVNSTADTCSLADQCLRRAITLANADAASDTIVFDIPGDPAQPRRIVLGSELKITQPVVIDGYTQPGSSPNTLEEGTNAQIRIVIDAAGAGDAWAALNFLKGPALVRGVALVNSRLAGLYVAADAAEVTLAGSFVGVEADGVTPAPNQRGVYLSGEFNTIGGAAPADRNLISASRQSGVLLYGNQSIRNAVVGNLIGTDRHGAPVLGNAWSGVQVTNARLSRIGGYSRALQNVIAGNGHEGVYLISNQPPGIENLEVVSRIYGNAGIGAIESDCALANDPGDADTGANECLNHPVIATARVFDGELVIEGAFDSLPNRLGRVALYGNTRACRPARGGEGGHFLGYVTIGTDAGGHAAFRFATRELGNGYTSVSAIAGVGQEDIFVDATSRFSPCVPVAYADRIFAHGFQ